MFVTGALCALHGMYRVQRYLNAKSFRHYANDAYSPYEVLHVIGHGQDHFLSSKDRKRENERGRDIQKKRIEEEEWGDEKGAPRTRGTEESPFGFYRALLQREYIPYFRRGLGERPKERPKRSKGKNGERQGKREYPREKRRDTQGRRNTAFLSPKRIYFSFAR